ncbi:hypothetical protein ACVBEH_06405 [Roseateles sp. GG27B]
MKRIPMTQADRMLSYLPLAHVVERTLVEHQYIERTGMSLFLPTAWTPLRPICSAPGQRYFSRCHGFG